MSEIEKKEESAGLAVVDQGLMAELYSDVKKSDFVIHSLMLTQAMSPFAGENGAAKGDIFHNGLNKPILKQGEKLLFIPAGHMVLLRKEELKDSKYVKKSVEPWPKEYEPQREDIEDGVPIRNIKVVKYYGHLKSDLENGQIMPITIYFMKSSLKVGLSILTNFVSSKNPIGTYVELSTKHVSKNNNNWYEYVSSITEEETSVEHQKVAVETIKGVIEMKKQGQIVAEGESDEAEDQSENDEAIPF